MLQENKVNTKNIGNIRNILTGGYETETILSALRDAYELAISQGKDKFTWSEVENNISDNNLHGMYWFQVMLSGRNAPKGNTQGRIDAFPGSSALDDTGGFIEIKDKINEENITNENFRGVLLSITDKTKQIIYR